MKKTLLFSRLIAIGLMMLFSSGWAFGQVTIVSQGFETDLTGYSHTPSQTPASDPGDQYFYRAEPSDAAIYEGSVGPYTNVTGSWLFVGSNPNTINGNSEGLLTLSGIDVTGYTDLEFHADFGACPGDWDDSDDLRIEYNFDGGAWSTLFSFAVDAGSDGTNEPLELSGNAVGGINTADGIVLTYDLVTVSSDNFTGTGTTLNIRLACNSGANYEAFGVDNFVIKGVSGGTPTPTITVSETTLTGFTYIEGNGPSAEQSFTVEGANLTANISIAASTNYEISETSGSGYTSPITLTQSGGTVSSTTLYTRLKAGLLEGDYNAENITATSTDATDKTVACSGSVTIPTLTITGPNGGEVTYAGQTYNIEWTSSSYTGTVDLEYYDGSTYTSIADGETDDGSYSFTIPSDITPGTTYKIRISDDRTSITTSDESDADFEVKASVFLSGTMNGWDGDALTYQEDLGTASWKYTYQENSETATEFVFRPTTANWDNKWARGDVVSMASLTTWWNSGGNGTYTSTLGKFYTYIFKDVAVGVDGEGYVFETTAAPVSLDAVSHTPEYAFSTTPVVVSITASATPNVEEKVYVRYTTDSWATNSYVLAAFTGTDGTATIPAQAEGTDVEYYALSTCVADITAEANADLATLNYNVNSGSNYTYTVLGDNTLIISQYYEGASSDKYIEINNVGSSEVDLSSYYLGLWSNTETPTGNAGSSGVLSGTIAAGATQIYKNSGAVNPVYAVAAATANNSAVNFNGNDVVALTRTGNDWDDRVDCIYAAGYWGSNTSFFRKGDVLTGNTAISVLDGSGEWIEVSNDDVNNAGLRETEYLSVHFLSTTWTGFTDLSWVNASNWSNGVPTLDLDVFIPVIGTVYPTLASGLNGYVNSLEIAAGAEMDILATGTLNIKNPVVVVSDETESGSLIALGSIGYSSSKSTFAGDPTLTYERYVTGDEWHLISTPVLNQQIVNLLNDTENDIVNDGTDYDMKAYDEATDNWGSLFTFANTEDMELGQGYAIRRDNPGLISMSGSPYSGATYTLSLDGGVNSEGWNLLGNPFPSAVAANSTADGTNNLLSINSSVLDPSFTALYVWDHTSSSYLIVNHSGGDPAVTLSQDFLQAGQGFFVRAGTDGATFSMTALMQSHQTGVDFKSTKESTWASIRLNAEISNAKTSTSILYRSDMNKGLDIGYDAGLFASNPNLSLYSRLVEDNGVDFGMQCLPEDYDNLIIPIGLDAKAGEIVTFSAKSLNIPEDYAVVLEDRAMNVFTNLSDEVEYAVQLDNASEGTGRFFVRTSMKSALGIDDIEKGAFQVFTRVNDRQLVIRGETTANTTARIYSITGKQIATINLEQATEQAVQFNEESGVYIVQISNEQGTFTQKFSWVK